MTTEPRAGFNTCLDSSVAISVSFVSVVFAGSTDRVGAIRNPMAMSNTKRNTDVNANTSRIENEVCSPYIGIHSNNTNNTKKKRKKGSVASSLPVSISDLLTLITLTQALLPNAMLPAIHAYHATAPGRGTCSVSHRKLRSNMPKAEESVEKPKRRSKWRKLTTAASSTCLPSKISSLIVSKYNQN